MRIRRIIFAVAAALCLGLLLGACSGSPQHSAIPGDTTCDGTIQGPSPTYVTVWFHTGQPSEKQTLNEQVAAFNASQKQVQVKLIDIPKPGTPPRSPLRRPPVTCRTCSTSTDRISITTPVGVP